MMRSNRVSDPAPKPAAIAERLLAHARFCRQIAEQSRFEETVAGFSRLADECSRLATDVEQYVDTDEGTQVH